MARAKKEDTKQIITKQEDTEIDLFTKDLIKTINRETGREVAYNLGDENAPTVVKYWISSGSRLLDAAIANGFEVGVGGIPGGRIIEIFGAQASGKSTLAQHIARHVNHNNGIVIYIDSENATSIHNLQLFGIDVTKRFVFVQPQTIEEVFSIASQCLEKTKNLKQDIPVLIVWDSLAATATKAEVEGDHDQQFMGVQARAVSQGIKKFNSQLVDSRATFLVLNQMRQKIGVMFGDPWTTSGGNALPYYASLRLKLSSSLLKDKDGKVYGTKITATIVKNRMGPPHREVSFELHYGKGIRDGENAFELFQEYCKSNQKIELDELNLCVEVPESSQWRTLSMYAKDTGVETEPPLKFRKGDFGEEFWYNPKYQTIVHAMLNKVFKIVPKQNDLDKLINNPTYNPSLQSLNEDSYD